jgi:hypothetical protein
MFPTDQFYKRKDRNGEYKWTISYCDSCNVEKTKESRHKNPEYYKERSKNCFIICVYYKTKMNKLVEPTCKSSL